VNLLPTDRGKREVGIKGSGLSGERKRVAKEREKTQTTEVGNKKRKN